jgi:hypothetical protein
MRTVALARKNWLHIGSPQAGPKVAAILSVVENCRRLQVPVRDYFPRFSRGLPISGSNLSTVCLLRHLLHIRSHQPGCCLFR